MSGLRRNALRFPLATRVLCRFVNERVPDFAFTSLSLFLNVKADFHVDSYNSPDHDNCVFKLNSFEKGGIWVEHSDGLRKTIGAQAVQGTILDFTPQGYVRVNARQLRHATESWKGERLVLAAFTINSPASLASHDVSFAKALGFPLAQPDVGPSVFQAGVPAEATLPRPVAFELFCGSASLSRELNARGFQIFACDRDTTSAKSAALKLDLQDDAGQTLFWSMWSDAGPHFVHLGPPCGTASRARVLASALSLPSCVPQVCPSLRL